MRYAVIAAAALVLAGCDIPGRAADRARAICVENGVRAGSPEFDACFQSVFSTIYPSTAGVRVQTAR